MTWLEQLSNSLSSSNISVSFGPHPLTEARNGLSEIVNAPILQWGFMTGFVVATYLHYVTRNLKWIKRFQGASGLIINQLKYSYNLISSLIVAILLIPVFVIVLSGFYGYRKILEIFLKRKYKDSYCGLLEGHDANWVLEDNKCKSVINILATFEGNQSVAQMLITLRKRMATKLLGKHHTHPKLFYRRGIEGGYSFWYKVHPAEIHIEDFVRLVCIPSSDEDSLTKEELKSWIGDMYNANLPKDHTTSWEILVSNKPLKTEGTVVYPILFRVHHSLGDGVALLRFVLDTIADKKSSTVDLWIKGQKMITNGKIMTFSTNLKDVARKDSITGQPIWSLEINLPTFKAKLSKAFSIFRMIYQCPMVLSNQLLLRKVDLNSLHHPENEDLTESKFVNWRSEPDEDLFYKMKSIKATHPGIRFSDVLLTALSSSLFQHFKTKLPRYRIPKELTLVIPMRMGPMSKKLELHNRFSVGLQTLPIASHMATTRSGVMENILRTHGESQKLMSGIDLYLNYWILGTASALIPLPILGPMVRSKHCTMVLSNLPGPKEEITVGQATMKELSFWLPNRGSTGLGVTLITYEDKVQIGIGGDDSVFDDPKMESQMVMDTVIEEINRMYELCCEN